MGLDHEGGIGVGCGGKGGMGLGSVVGDEGGVVGAGEKEVEGG